MKKIKFKEKARHRRCSSYSLAGSRRHSETRRCAVYQRTSQNDIASLRLRLWQRSCLPYGRRDGMFWTLTERLSGVTIRPSVGSFNLPCKSHYYITDNKVEWL